MQQVLLHFSGSIGNIKIFSSIKNLGQYEKLPLDKFVQKKKNIAKTFRSMQNCLELQQYLVLT